MLLVFSSFICMNAQTSKSAAQKIQDEKISFFNEELGLSKAESEAFWPLYTDFQNRRNRIVAEKRNLMQYYTGNRKNIPESEITEILNKYISLEKQETALLESYNEKFRKILSDDKVFRIYLTEIKFKDYLLKKLRTR